MRPAVIQWLVLDGVLGNGTHVVQFDAYSISMECGCVFHIHGIPMFEICVEKVEWEMAFSAPVLLV